MNKKTRHNRYKPEPKDKKNRFAIPGKDTGIKIILLAVFMVIAGLGSIYVHDFIMQADYFTIRKIEISGNQMVHRQELLGLTGIKPNDTLYTINLFKIKKQLIFHPWIHSVSLKRDLPDTLLISVTEEEALAVIALQTSEKILINKKGVPFKEYVLKEDKDLNLPVVNGLQLEQKDAAYGFNQEVFNFVLDILTTPVDMSIHTIKANINTGISIEVPDQFNLYADTLENTIWLKLGFGNYAEKINRARKLSLYMQQHFAQKKICSMDLFDMENIFVKIKEDENALHNNLKKGV